MRWLARFSVQNPVVVNLMVFAVVAAGIIFGFNLRREFFPEVRPNQVMVIAPYPGATPDQIEHSLARKIEDAVQDINEIKEITTTATEGLATVVMEFHPGTLGIDEAVARVKRRIDALQDLPPQAERIIVRELEPNLPTISLSIYGDIDERLAKEEIRRIRDDLRTLPDMGTIVLSGARADEITVEVTPEALVEHGLSLPAIADAIRAAMADIPGGALRTPTANIAVRTVPVQERAQAVRSIILRAGEGSALRADGQGRSPEGGSAPRADDHTGAILRLDDIADVRLGFEDTDIRTRLNGKTAVSLTAFKVGQQDAVKIAGLVRAYAQGRMGEPLQLTWTERLGMLVSRGDETPQNDRIAAYHLGAMRAGTPPGGIGGQIALHTDLSRFITGRLELLGRNALQGGTLVFLLLLLFLNLRVALWVTAGLIVAIFGTLAAMSFTGITLNLLTMFGLIIVIGILVDDAIVVAENILARHEAGEPAMSAAVNGMHEVGWPVVATVLTTIFAFGSLLLIQGRMGDLLAALPMVVAVALAVSLFEALYVLPSHMAHTLKAGDAAIARGRISRLRRIEARLQGMQQWVLQRWLAPKYMRLLRIALRYRYLTLSIAIAVLIVSIGMAASGRPAFDFMGTTDSETIVADLRMPIGTSMETTDRIMRRLEAAALAQPEVTSALAIVGARGSADGTEQIAQPHLGQMYIELMPAEKRDRTSDELIVGIRRAAGELTGIKSLRLDAISGGPEGPPLSLTVSGEDPDRIAVAVEQLKSAMASFDGVYDVADDADRGKRELRIELLPGARELGFTTRDLAMQVRGAVHGIEAHTFAIPGEDVDVRVKLDEPTRRSLAAIERMHIFTPAGIAVPITEVARISEAESFATVRRVDRRRAVTLTAEVDKDIVSPEAVAAELAPVIHQITRDNPDLLIRPRGRQEQVRDSLASLPLGMLVAISLIYVNLAWLFRSYMLPLVILCAVPFAIIGMVWGHIVMGFDMTILSLIGFVALSGIVVNNALVFTQFYMMRRREGETVTEAALETGRQRLRPIILTTITTIGGLSPLMMEQSFQAMFLIPMAITISFGLLSATFIALLVLPCLLLIGHDIREIAYLAWRGEYLPERETVIDEEIRELVPLHPDVRA